MKTVVIPSWFLLFLLLVVLVSCNQTTETPKQQSGTAASGADSLAKKLEPLNRSLETAMYAGDYETLLNSFCEDAVMKPANRPAVRGFAAIRQSYEEQKKLEVKILSFRPEVEKIWAVGNDIHEYGTYAQSVTYKGAEEPKAYTGSYFLIYEAQKNGGYKIRYMLTNLDFLPRH